ncbi:MAG TPA: phosphatase PAP2 family protein [Methylophilaceae bacterium]|nr:phosphatase PAP2 family protein [Methylophilaceae bacterium]
MNEIASALSGSFIGEQGGNLVGTNALNLYFLGLTVLFVITLSSHSLIRYLQQKYTQDSSDLPLYFAVAIMVTCIAGFAIIAAALAEIEALPQFDHALADSVGMSTPPAALQFFALVTHAGDTFTYTVICTVMAGAMLLSKRYLLALGTVMAIGGNSILNPSLKAIFERVRPVHEHGLVVANGWSFPSGHTSGAVVTYGIIAYILLRSTPRQWHPAILVSVVSLAFTIACSRVFLQVHYLSDVIAGALSGLCWLTLTILTIHLLEQRHNALVTPAT